MGIYTQIEVAAGVFPLMSWKKSPPLDCHRAVERGGNQPHEFNEGALQMPKHQEHALGN